jgi:DNA-binding response OmpR family regulator
MQVLIIEDDLRIATLLQAGLDEEGYQVVTETDGGRGLNIASACPFDLIVLDLMLPTLDGFEVVRQLRHGGNRTPILMLTARDANRDIVQGLDLGADDYLTKPFSLEVFLARVRAVSRRGPIARTSVHRIDDLVIEPGERRVTRAGRPLPLTRREFSLLELLARSSPRVVTRHNILEEVWGYDSEVSTNNLEAFVSALRTKIDLTGAPKLIHTVRGVGYCLRKEVEE